MEGEADAVGLGEDFFEDVPLAGGVLDEVDSGESDVDATDWFEAEDGAKVVGVGVNYGVGEDSVADEVLFGVDVGEGEVPGLEALFEGLGEDLPIVFCEDKG